jgi:hypothetical protein
MGLLEALLLIRPQILPVVYLGHLTRTSMPSIEKLLIYDSTRSRSTAHVFIAHASPAEERVLGKLGFIAELESNDRVNHELLSRIQDFLKAAYYTSPETNPEVAFEHTIQACNRYISELVGDFGSEWVDTFSMIIFTVREEKMYFSDVGRLIGWLIHGRHIVDLLGKTRGMQRPNPLKMFSAIASGVVQGQDAIFFGTPNLLDYFSVEKIRRTVSEAPLGGAAKHLEDTLRQDPNSNAFAAVITQSQVVYNTIETAPVPVKINVPGAPKRSLDALLAQDIQTQALLTPSLWPAVKKGAKKLIQKSHILFRAWVLRKPTRVSPVFVDKPQPETENNERVDRRAAFQPVRKSFFTNATTTVLKKIPQLIRRGGESAMRATPKILGTLRRAGRQVQQVPKLIPAVIDTKVSTVKQMPQRSKTLLLSIGTVAVIFAITLIIIGVQRHNRAIAQASDQQYAQIEEKVATAKTSLLYGDEERARTLLSEAQTTFNQLTQTKTSTKSVLDRRAAIQKSLEETLVLTRHAISTAPEHLTDLPADGQYVGLIQLGQGLYTFDSKQNKLTSVELSTNSVKNEGTFPGDKDLLYATSHGSGGLIGLTGNLQVIEQTTTGKSGTRIPFAPPSQTSNLVGVASYNTAIYTIDVAANTILRATKQNGEFKGSTWSRQTVKLDNAVDLAVDGSIYTLSKNGEVQKFTLGNRSQFVLSTIDPPLQNAKQIVGDVNVQNIYILDTVEHRIVVFTKTGKFVNQYTPESLKDVSYFTVDEHAQKIYLLRGNIVEKLSISK